MPQLTTTLILKRITAIAGSRQALKLRTFLHVPCLTVRWTVKASKNPSYDTNRQYNSAR